MNMCELLTEANFTQHDLEFCGMVPPTFLQTDADVAKAFCHMRGVAG